MIQVKALQRPVRALTSLLMMHPNAHSGTLPTGRRVRRAAAFCGAVSLLLASSAHAAPPVASRLAPRLKTRLDAILNVAPRSKAQVSARVIDLEQGAILYDLHGNRPLLPASNMKLIVIAAAIDRLGPDFKFRTVLAIRDTDLVVIGGGDPTFGDQRLAEARGETITAVFHEWARAIKDAGVRQIPGDIVVDDLIFDLTFRHPNWPKDQYQKWYEAPVGGLNFNANCVETHVAPTAPKRPARITLVPGNTLIEIRNKTVTGKKNTVVVARPRDSDVLVVSGSVAKECVLQEVTVRDPGLYFGSVLKTVLAAEGIPVGGKVVRERVRLDHDRLPPDCYVIGVHRAPLADALGRAGKDSLGLMAEVLLKTLGARRGDLGTWTSGRSEIHAFLRQAAVPANQVKVDDGSGLSRSNRLSAAAATEVLRYMFKEPRGRFDLLKDSLAVAGIDGTLKKRLRGSDTKGRIYAKTGTINGVRTLAGYLHTKSDRWLAFAFFYNYSGKSPAPKQRMDRACRLLVQWSRDREGS